ncbi:MAG: LacI family DNA-binding transcriptional regulator [Paracoccaceae bacterium]|jgi:DNA-binding LacI/PurR family transcriptional regulator|nr:LacI family DNA-binding transcriptional regulator [Paracoccaceae bacterium]
MSEKVSARHVADLAGVSRSAVSRVFTPGASVSKATAEKVRKAAAELGYRPNVLARSLITGRSRIIGLVVAYLENYFYPEALEKLSTALQGRGYHVLVFMTSDVSGDVDEVLSGILDYQVDGIIAASVALSSDLATRCRAAGVPVVLFNRSQDMAGVASVASDNHGGGREIARFLVAGGHRRIAYIAGWEGASTQRDREAGFRDGLAEAGLALCARGVGDYRHDRAAAAARAMFDRPDRPDAVFVANDHMAFAVMDVLRFELGLSVPGDVSVVGYDDVPPAAWPAYALTTVRQRANLMVERTVEVLLAQIEDGAAAGGPHIVPGPLIVRGSAQVPEGWT